MIKRIEIFSLLSLFASFSLIAQYDFTADVTEGCDSLTVNFSFTSTASVDTITYIIWDLFKPGSPDTTFNISDVLSAKYSIPADYPVIVYINNADDPPVTVKNNYIRLHRTVSADFTGKDTSEFAPNSYFFEHMDQPYDVSATYTYSWDFDDGNTGTGEDIIHTYASPGTYNVSLNVTDNYGCTDTKSTSITVLAPPPGPDFTANVTEGCDTIKVKFGLVNVSTDSTVLWDFGNGQSSNLHDPDTVVYYAGEEPISNFTVRVFLYGNNDNTIEKTDFITVHRSRRATFSCVDTLLNPTSIVKVCFNTDPLIDTSATYEYTWRMQGFSPNNDVRPLYTFANEADTIPASLTINDLTNGCSNTLIQNVIIFPEIIVQNVFTPNDDGINDFFVINSNGSVLLNLKIFSRTGLLLFEGEGTEVVWDGRTASGLKLNPGIYYYILSSSESDDPLGKFNKTGFIYLFR